MSVDADGPLEPARRQLSDAVHALVDPIPEWADGVCRWSESLYIRLRGALTGTQSRRRSVLHRSKLPCRVDALNLLVDIDTTAAVWQPDDIGTVERLQALTTRGWRPQDCSVIDDYSTRIQHWTLTASDMLAESPRVFLHAPCPRCGHKFTYKKDSAGEMVRTRTLRVSETGCQCLACGMFWEPERFHWLAKLLGCPELPAA